MGAKVLIGCENSGIVRDAFINIGIPAVSCDVLQSDRPGPHIRADILDVLDKGWLLLIAHPPCTYLCSSGLHWNSRPGNEWRVAETEKALDFVRILLNAPIEHIAIENPVGRIGTAIRKASQYIQPYHFGHDASKKTGLWLKNLPILQPTEYIKPRIVLSSTSKELERWSNQTDSGQNRVPPSADRWKLRAETYQGVADAMANQWGRYLKRIGAL